MSNNLWEESHQTLRGVLKQIRLDAGLTQAQLANELQKPQSFVSKYESGERRLDYLEVREVCIQCNTTIPQFEKALSTLI